MSQNLNLIPSTVQRRYAMRRLSRVWLTWAVASGAFAGLFLGVEWLRGVASLRELMELDARYAPFQLLAKEREVLAEKIADLRSREVNALKVARGDYGMTVLGVLSKAVATSDGDVYLDALTYRAPAADRNGVATTAVQVSGVGLDGVSVAEFAAKLRESGVFREVTVQNTQPIGGGAASVRRFSLAGVL